MERVLEKLHSLSQQRNDELRELRKNIQNVRTETRIQDEKLRQVDDLENRVEELESDTDSLKKAKNIAYGVLFVLSLLIGWLAQISGILF